MKCPACNQKGKPVKELTLRSLLKPDVQKNIKEEKYRFCVNPKCTTVYYSEDSSDMFSKSEMTVRVGIKETEAPRYVCYCFDHTIEKIEQEVQNTGKSTVLDDIKTKMKEACWCETKSPQGSCCLGTVNKEIKKAIAKYGMPDSNTKDEKFEDCCSEIQENTLDLLVIGAGSGGFSAAITAAEKGANVVIAGEGTIGGTCVNVGCVPSKTLLRAVESLHQAKNASRFAGITGNAKINNWQEVIAQKKLLVEKLRKEKYIDVLSTYSQITYVEGKAKFTSDGLTINNRIYHPKKIIIATGSSSSLPSIKGIEDIPYLTSTTALELKELPKSLLIIGGGYIGCELGQIFARAGVKVTISCRRHLLPDAEPEISDFLTKYLRKEGIEVYEGVSYQKIETTTSGVALTYERKEAIHIIETEKILLTAGRKPNTTDMGLENVKVKITNNAGIQVNEYLQSSNNDIYAVGDVTGKDMFVYMAAYGGKLAANNALQGNSMKYDNSAMPSVVFTDPQVASVGLTESQAKTQGYEVKTSLITLDHVPRSIAARDTRGVIKLIADSKTDKLLGAHILAPEAGDSIQTMVMALKGKLTTKDLANTIFPYLTTVEGLKLAAQTFDKDVNKLSCCAG